MNSSSSSDREPAVAPACRVCGGPSPAELLNLGPQPLCNRFPASSGEDEYTHPMVLAQCATCGVLQLGSPVPPAELVPPHGRIRQNEPEGHLDQVADAVCGLPGVHRGAVACGLTYKDVSTLERLRRRGYRAGVEIDPARDLDITDPRAGVETVQDRLTPGVAARIVARHGPADLVIARHIFEHAHDPDRFLAFLRRVVKPDGYLVLELPDSTRALETRDYSMLWEEHVLYLTAATARRCFAAAGWSIVRFDVYPYPYEDSLVIVARPGSALSPAAGEAAAAAERRRAEAFARGLHERRDALRGLLGDHRRRDGKIAMFGAGHRACTFINIMRLGTLIDFVVDDDPRKVGRVMPGSRVPIVDPSALLAEQIRLCLMSLSPESEAMAMRRNRAFTERGGRFASIFPAGRDALQPADERTWSN